MARTFLAMEMSQYPEGASGKSRNQIKIFARSLRAFAGRQPASTFGP
jgi:hypothetical protein